MGFNNCIELLLESTCFLFEGNTIDPVINLAAYSVSLCQMFTAIVCILCVQKLMGSLTEKGNYR